MPRTKSKEPKRVRDTAPSSADKSTRSSRDNQGSSWNNQDTTQPNPSVSQHAEVELQQLQLEEVVVDTTLPHRERPCYVIGDLEIPVQILGSCPATVSVSARETGAALHVWIDNSAGAGLLEVVLTSDSQSGPVALAHLVRSGKVEISHCPGSDDSQDGQSPDNQDEETWGTARGSRCVHPAQYRSPRYQVIQKPGHTSPGGDEGSGKLVAPLNQVLQVVFDPGIEEVAGQEPCRSIGPGSGQGAPAGGSGRGHLHISLAPDAFGDAPRGPADLHPNCRWHGQLLALLEWLVPSWFTISGTADGAAQDGTRQYDAAELYSWVRPPLKSSMVPPNLPQLAPTLRPYQRRAVHWMLVREGAREPDRLEAREQVDLHPLWTEVRVCQRQAVRLTGLISQVPGSSLSRNPSKGCHGSFFVNLYTGAVSLTRYPAPPEVSGGMLCEEMGLGKTVELLATIVNNRFKAPKATQAQRTGGYLKKREPRPQMERIDCVCGYARDDPEDTGDYCGQWVQCGGCLAWCHAPCVGYTRTPKRRRLTFERDSLSPARWECGRCQRGKASEQVVIPTGTTLVVVPQTILPQWVEEIRRHVVPGTLTMKIYEGQGGGPSGDHVTTAAELACHDLVLTTYDVLRKDLSRQPDVQDSPRKLRGGKRYEVCPTPLTRLIWWRVCLDEAQLVESSTAKATEMARKLQAVHRWCISGTPVCRGMEDIYGLMTFLRVQPWSERWWWNKVLGGPLDRLVKGEHGGALGDHGVMPGATLAEGSNVSTGLSKTSRSAARAWALLVATLNPAEGGLMWRTRKNDVWEELGVPPQHHHTSVIQMSAIERHFYQRQHQECVVRARNMLPKEVRKKLQEVTLQLPTDVTVNTVEHHRQVELDMKPSANPTRDEKSDGVADAVMSDHLPGSEDPSLNWVSAGGCCEGGTNRPTEGEVASTSYIRSALPQKTSAVCQGGQQPRPEPRSPDGRGKGTSRPPSTPCSPIPHSHHRPHFFDPILDAPLPTHLQKKLLLPLLRLRQACCHPQIGAGGLKSGTATRAPMSMGEVLEVLITRAKLEAEEALRLVAAALNGLGGIMWLEGNKVGAVAAYREALSLAEAHKEDVRMDPLQKLHTLRNLAELLGLNEGGVRLEGVPHTLRDDQLVVQAAEIRDKYLADRVVHLSAARREYQNLLDKSYDQVKVSHDAGGQGVSKGTPSRQSLGNGEVDGRPPGVVENVVLHVELSSPKAWYLDVLDLAVEAGLADELVLQVKERLLEQDTYRRKVSKNAASLANRFHNCTGLKYVIAKELEDTHKAAELALQKLMELDAQCGGGGAASTSSSSCSTTPSASFISQAGQCGRCRAEMGVKGLVCEHCRLDELFLKWEVHLFSIYSNSQTRGAVVDADVVARRAQEMALMRVGRGGLHEEDQEGSTSGDVMESRGGAFGGTDANIVRHPSETERVLQMLARNWIRRLPVTVQQREILVATARAHVDCMEAQRKLYLGARAVALSQRQLLYAYDELDMATVRLRLWRAEDMGSMRNFIKDGVTFVLTEDEVPYKNTELTNDKIVAQAELGRTLGVLRYLQRLKSARSRQVPGNTEGTSGCPPDDTEGGDMSCPICQENVGAECVMLPCGHHTCVSCSVLLTSRIPPGLPLIHRRIKCPTCRVPVHISEVAYVDEGQMTSQEGSNQWSQEAALKLHGSYGTKIEAVVRRVMYLLLSDASCRVIVFSSWTELLDIVAHALKTNKVEFAYGKGKKGLVDAVALFKSCHVGEGKGPGEGTELEEDLPQVLGEALEKGHDLVGRKQMAEPLDEKGPCNEGVERPPGEAPDKGDAEVPEEVADPLPSGAHPVNTSSSLSTPLSSRSRRPCSPTPGTRGGGPRLLLMLVHQGGLGLNLTEAQHVLFIDPLLDKALEAQAIGRVHRIGQARETHVHRFVVQHSVEENVYWLAQDRRLTSESPRQHIGSPGRSYSAATGTKPQDKLTFRDVALLLKTEWGREVERCDLDGAGGERILVGAKEGGHEVGLNHKDK